MTFSRIVLWLKRLLMDSKCYWTTKWLILGFFVGKWLLPLTSYLFGLKSARIAQFLFFFDVNNIGHALNTSTSSSTSFAPLIRSNRRTDINRHTHARSSLRSSPASFQSASRLYYCSATPRLFCHHLFLLCIFILVYLFLFRLLIA